MSQSENIDIDYLAQLARIELSNEEKTKYASQLSQVLGYFKKLSEVNVDNVEPCAHAHAIHNVWRKDEATETLSLEKALMNAPIKRDFQVVVPKVVDDA